MTYDRQPIINALAGTLDGRGLIPLMPALSAAKNDAYVTLAKGRMALRPVNNGVIKATETDRSIEMEGKTAQLKADYQNLVDLWELGMAVIK